MQYFAYMKQKGEGCDYTIGCGRDLITLEAIDKEDAIKELKEYFRENCPRPDYGLESILLIEGNAEIIDVESWYEEIEQEKKDEELKEQEKKELELFEKLKKKFDK